MVNRIVNRARKLLPGYGWACFAVIVAVQFLVYYALRLLLPYVEPKDLAISLDALIPFRPEWFLVYVLSFASWFITLFLLLRQRREHVYRNTAAYLVTLLITATIFLLVPGTMTRPEVTGKGFFPWLARFIYSVDPPNNLFPSLHVICSYYCWRCLFDTEGLPLWYRRFNFVFLILVCCSIVLVKQHVVVDIPSALVVAETPLQLAKRFRWERLGYAMEHRLQAKNRQ